MKEPTFKKLNNDFDAEPNAPNPELLIKNNDLILTFGLNSFLWTDVEEGGKGKITFRNCLKYRLGSPNDEGFRNFRYYKFGIKFYDFYLVQNSDWRSNFPDDQVVIQSDLERADLNHYIFFFRDETFECIADSYIFEKIEIKDLLDQGHVLIQVRLKSINSVIYFPIISERIDHDQYKLIRFLDESKQNEKLEFELGEIVTTESKLIGRKEFKFAKRSLRKEKRTITQGIHHAGFRALWKFIARLQKRNGG